MKEILEAIGINGPSTVAGFTGGLVNVFWLRKMAPFDVIGALIAGAATANYLGAPLAEVIHFPVGATSFLFGIGGLQITGPLLAMLRRKIFSDGEDRNATP